MKGKLVVVYGDIVADRFIYGTPKRISREAPVLILSARGMESDKVRGFRLGQLVSASLLALYRTINAPGAQDAQIRNDFGGAFADAAPENFGRYYGGWWETRNLRMVANIREAITLHPGARVLNIVGASHKPWYDQWARQMADVEVVDTHALLAE